MQKLPPIVAATTQAVYNALPKAPIPRFIAVVSIAVPILYAVSEVVRMTGDFALDIYSAEMHSRWQKNNHHQLDEYATGAFVWAIAFVTGAVVDGCLKMKQQNHSKTI